MVVFGPDRTFTEVLYAGGQFNLINGSAPSTGGYLYTTNMDGGIYDKNFFEFNKEVFAITPYYTSGGTPSYTSKGDYQILVGGDFTDFNSIAYNRLIRLDGTLSIDITLFVVISIYIGQV
jgi:hypothetical protein